MRTEHKFRLLKPIGALFLLAFCGVGKAGAQSDYTAITVDNDGTITGTVKWVGPVPKIPKLPVTKNPELCDPDSLKVRDLERLEIDSDEGVGKYRGIPEGRLQGQSHGSSRRPPAPGSENVPLRPAHHARAARRQTSNKEQ
jgi:hypothetical protein